MQKYNIFGADAKLSPKTFDHENEYDFLSETGPLQVHDGYE